MKKLLAIISVVLFANQASAEQIRVGDVFYCEMQQRVETTFSDPSKVRKLSEPKKFKFVVKEKSIQFGSGGWNKGMYYDIKNLDFYDNVSAGYEIANMVIDYKNPPLKLVHTITFAFGASMMIATCDKF